jgi:hypothetical protein
MAHFKSGLQVSAVLSALLGTALALSVNGCKECDTTSVYESFEVAYKTPGSFDAWLAAHPDYFNEERLQCLQESAQRFNSMYLELADNCDAAHPGGGEDWTACMIDADVSAGYQRDALIGIHAAASGTAFTQSLFYREDYLFWTTSLRYQYFVLPFSDATVVSIFQQTTQCEECKTNWLIF